MATSNFVGLFSASQINFSDTDLNPFTFDPTSGALSNVTFDGQALSVSAPVLQENAGTRVAELPEKPINAVIRVSRFSNDMHLQHHAGDLMFSIMDRMRNLNSATLMNLPQLQETMRACSNSLQKDYSLRESYQRAVIRGIYAQEPVLQYDNELLDLFGRIRTEGDWVCFADPKLAHSIRTEKKFQPLRWILPQVLMETVVRFLGILINSGAANKLNTRTLEMEYVVATGGNSYYQETPNIWGDVSSGHRLFLVLRRSPDGHLYFDPVFSSDKSLPLSTTQIYDFAGHLLSVQTVIPLGQVTRFPMQNESLDPSQRKSKAGLIASAQQSADMVIDGVYMTIGLDLAAKYLYNI